MPQENFGKYVLRIACKAIFVCLLSNNVATTYWEIFDAQINFQGRPSTDVFIQLLD